MPSLSTALRAPAFQKARHVARSWVHENVDRPIVSALTTTRALRSGGADVVFFGDSTLLLISPYDTDRRRLGEMFADTYGQPVAQFYGPGYQPTLFLEMTRLLAQEKRKPKAIVISVPIRTATQIHVSEHPVYGYKHAHRTLARAKRLGPGLLRHVRRPIPTPEEYARFDALVRDSRWGGEQTVGHYRRGLKGYDTSTASEEQIALLYDYFHGEYVAGNPGLATWRQVGRQLRELGVPVIGYQPHMPHETGARIYGEDFLDHVGANYRLVADAFNEGIGRDDVIVPIEPPADKYYIDPLDGTEHFNQDGRMLLADQLTTALRRVI